ncbi:MAG: prolyl oligopeptidase family serine peptidase, partial [Lentimonas sp.]
MLSIFKLVALLLLFPLLAVALHAENQSDAQWPGEEASFHGFTQHNFKIDGLNCKIVAPKKIAAGKPWIWRARFFGHEPQVDIACLEQGFHVAYVDVSGLFGSPKAMKRFDTFYEYLTKQHSFSQKPALEGMSRGGLTIYNWASANPDKVSCIYADAPVCDFKSWPGGKGTGKGSKKAWAQCLKAYGFTEAQALDYAHNPLNNLKPLASADIALLHVVGDTDVVVPVAENTAMLEQAYTKLGGSIEVIH